MEDLDLPKTIFKCKECQKPYKNQPGEEFECFDCITLIQSSTLIEKLKVSLNKSDIKQITFR